MQSEYKNLPQNFNSENQVIDTTVSSINEDKMIIKENNTTELAMIGDTKDEINSIKIEKDNFLDFNNKDIEKGNQNLLEKRLYNKRRFGKTCPFLFRDGEPLIVIGPHCKYFFRFFILFYN